MKILILFIALVFVFNEDCVNWTKVLLECPECLEKEVVHKVVCEEWKTTIEACLTGPTEGYWCTSNGDPHFKMTVGERTFDNFLIGDVVLAKCESETTPFEVHTRQEQWGVASINSAVAANWHKDRLDIVLYEVNKGWFHRGGDAEAVVPVSIQSDFSTVGGVYNLQIAGGKIERIAVAIEGNEELLERYKVTVPTGPYLDILVKKRKLAENEYEERFLNIILFVPNAMSTCIEGLCSMSHEPNPLFNEALGLFQTHYEFRATNVTELSIEPDFTDTELAEAKQTCIDGGVSEWYINECSYDLLNTFIDNSGVIDLYKEIEGDLGEERTSTTTFTKRRR